MTCLDSISSQVISKSEVSKKPIVPTYPLARHAIISGVIASRGIKQDSLIPRRVRGIEREGGNWWYPCLVSKVGVYRLERKFRK